jgi:hypothetical protein
MSILVDLQRYASVDLPLFREQLDGFLPDEVYDCHVHLIAPEHTTPPTPEQIAESWAYEAPHELTLEQLTGVQSLIFPGRRVRSLAFASPAPNVDISAGNRYVAGAIASGQADGLLVTRPEWPVEQVREQMLRGGFLGFKPYPGLVGTRADDVPLEAFFPPDHQALADELGLIVMLHIGRPERLRDPDNLREIRELRTTRPNLRLILAHIGRAYTLSYAAPGLQALSDLPDVYYDFAMNLNAEVMALTLQTIGPRRLLYGSDLPIALMRGVREHDGDCYINFSDGDYHWNTPDRRKSPAEEARYSLYLYEELLAFQEAARQVGLSPEDVAAIMGGTARELVAAARQAVAGESA